jgi:hypothetical protein
MTQGTYNPGQRTWWDDLSPTRSIRNQAPYNTYHESVPPANPERFMAFEDVTHRAGLAPMERQAIRDFRTTHRKWMQRVCI